LPRALSSPPSFFRQSLAKFGLSSEKAIPADYDRASGRMSPLCATERGICKEAVRDFSAINSVLSATFQCQRIMTATAKGILRFTEKAHVSAKKS
jgi:hypothetical protein